MFKLLKDLRSIFLIYKEVVSTFYVLRYEYNKKNPCKDSSLSHLECRELGIERGGYMSAILSFYKTKINDTN